MNNIYILFACVALGLTAQAGGPAADSGLKWIDGRELPLEGRAFADVAEFYDRLPAGGTNVSALVTRLLHDSSGLCFRFRTDSRHLRFRWTPRAAQLAMDHMPATGVSGIDVYRRGKDGVWRYVRTGRITNPKGAELAIDWTPGEDCIVNLPLYNGVRAFSLGVDAGAAVKAIPHDRSGVEKPVVFYGSSITQGGCASRPGLSFVNVIGRRHDWPVVNLGFSGAGLCELAMSEHLSRIDASCYVLDCVANMRGWPLEKFVGRYEPFVRNLRRLRPDVPILLVERADVQRGPRSDKDDFVRDLVRRLWAEGWKNLTYLPREEVFPPAPDGCEETVDGTHWNDLGMAQAAAAYGEAIRRTLIQAKPRGAGELRVVQWNMGHFAMGKNKVTSVCPEESAARAAQYRARLAALDADILGVCEYERVFDRAGTLATNAVFSSFPVRIEGPKNSYQCNAVMTAGRRPISSRVVDYKVRGQETYYLDTVFRLGTNDVHFVQTHLDWNKGERFWGLREAQLKQLFEDFRHEPYVIVSGDFNVAGVCELEPFRLAGWKLAVTDDRPPRIVDNIMAKGFEMSDIFTDDREMNLSDHLIVGCTLRLKPVGP